MPALVSSSNSHTRPLNKSISTTAHTKSAHRKTRVVKRRGRAKAATDSDEEIEREVGTDSDSDDDVSSFDSASDSDTEPASEDVATNGHLTSSSSHTSHILPESRRLDKEAKLNAPSGAFFSNASNWSEMVTDEGVHGPADLPVIEFSEFDSHVIPTAPPTRPGKKSAKHPPSTSTLPLSPKHINQQNVGPDELEPTASSSRKSTSPAFQRRPPGQTARQAYQQRLESDPSYVPTVGGFWGHDDRLLDKDLRSLSGWWRGRWQGRGRGRGFPTRGRGRGGMNVATHENASESNDGPPSTRIAETIPAIDRTWTHDGFEEMRRREDQHKEGQRRDAPHAHPPAPRGNARGAAHSRGRGSFTRGALNGRMAASANAGRVWYAMKPELTWTKQHDGFLYYDSTTKSRVGQGPTFRVRLPGKTSQIVRAEPRSSTPIGPANVATKTVAMSVSGSDYGERAYSVRLPNSKNNGKQKAIDVSPADDKPSLEDVFTVRPRLVPPNPIPLPSSSEQTPSVGSSLVEPQPSTEDSTGPGATIRLQLEQLSLEPPKPDSARWAQTEEAVLRNPPAAEPRTQDHAVTTAEHPPLPPLRTVFTPEIPQGTPPYGSPYAYAPGALPPGIALNQHGMPYELMTGRPVYLQHPSMVYNARPAMHTHMPSLSAPFVPGHMHLNSSLHVVPQPPSHSPIIDPTTGTTIFALPRQNMRVEIRTPTGELAYKPSNKPVQPSGLRSAATVFQPVASESSNDSNYYPSIATPVELPPYASLETNDGAAATLRPNGHQPHNSADGNLVPFAPYQHPYYYPEAYAYPQYMSLAQVGQYEMYPPESHPSASQGNIYY